MSYVTTKKGIRWHYNVLGRGPCLFFIHGWAANMRVFSQQARHFSSSHRTVLFDLPGHGKTEWIPVTFDDMAQEIKEIADHIGVEKFSIIGSSMGGFIGLKVSQLFPSSVERIVMVGSLPRFLRTQQYPIGLTVQEMEKLRMQIETRYPTILDIFFRSLFTREERESEKFKWIHQFRKQEKAPNKEALISFLEMLMHADLMVFLRTANVPIFFLAGRQDYICSEHSLKFIKEMMPQAQIDFMEGCGHFPFLINSIEFNNKVERFLLRR